MRESSADWSEASGLGHAHPTLLCLVTSFDYNFFQADTVRVTSPFPVCVCVCRLGSSPPGGTLKGRRLDETFECNERDRCLRCIRHVDYLSSSLTRRNGHDNLLLLPPSPPSPSPSSSLMMWELTSGR